MQLVQSFKVLDLLNHILNEVNIPQLFEMADILDMFNFVKA